MTLALLLACATLSESELVSQLDREVIALQRKNRLLEERLEVCDQGEDGAALLAQLSQVMSGTEVRVERDGPRAVIIIPGELLFASGSTEVRDEAMMFVDLLATALQLHPTTHAWVVAHTDDDPLSGGMKKRFGDNWGLSSARGQAFMQVLVERFGVDERRFTVSGKGASQPIATNDTPEGRALNRRIVVVLGPAESFR